VEREELSEEIIYRRSKVAVTVTRLSGSTMWLQKMPEKWPVFEFEVEDEQYLLDYDSRVTVLASTIFRGRQWPVVWTKPWGDGKVFYIALGHNPSACENKVFKKLFVGGVRWVLNPQPGPEPPTNKFAIS